jgi:hypothetical protein
MGGLRPSRVRIPPPPLDVAKSLQAGLFRPVGLRLEPDPPRASRLGHSPNFGACRPTSRSHADRTRVATRAFRFSDRERPKIGSRRCHLSARRSRRLEVSLMGCGYSINSDRIIECRSAATKGGPGRFKAESPSLAPDCRLNAASVRAPQLPRTPAAVRAVVRGQAARPG